MACFRFRFCMARECLRLLAMISGCECVGVVAMPVDKFVVKRSQQSRFKSKYWLFKEL